VLRRSMKISAIKGCYTLIILLDAPADILIGRRGNYSFRAGYYAYVGSALNSLEKRIRRHLRKEKKLHWHIDYLMQYAVVGAVIYAETNSNQECRVAQKLLEVLESVPGFGCSDCPCPSHLFYHADPEVLRRAVLTSFRNANLVPMEDIYLISIL
jgi:Uri superfamily endonuclease